MKRKIATAVLALGTLGLAAASGVAAASARICTKTGEPADPCCCRETDQGLVCTRTGEVLAECCCK